MYCSERKKCAKRRVCHVDSITEWVDFMADLCLCLAQTPHCLFFYGLAQNHRVYILGHFQYKKNIMRKRHKSA